MSTTATSRIHHAPEPTPFAGRAHPWVWPLPRLDGDSPCLLAATSGSPAGNVEIGYSNRMSTSSHVPVFAAQDGVLAYAAATNGHRTLCLDHAGGWSTQYAGLERLLVKPTDRFRRRRKERVQAGDIIGHAPRSTLRIGFTLTRFTDDECVIVDPGTMIPAWSLLPWFDMPLPPHPSVGDLHAVPGRSIARR